MVLQFGGQTAIEGGFTPQIIEKPDPPRLLPANPEVARLRCPASTPFGLRVSNSQNMLAADFQKSQRVQDREVETKALGKENPACQEPCPATAQQQQG